MVELRFSNLEFRSTDQGAVVEGVVLDYADHARIPGPGGRVLEEQVVPGAFSMEERVVANLLHDRRQPLGAHPDGGLEILDGPERMTAKLRLPDTSSGLDAKKLLERNILTGYSVEMAVEQDRYEGDLRIIERAQLFGLGLVDVPAYRLSSAVLKRWATPGTEDRAESYAGEYTMGAPETVSDKSGAGVVRKRAYRPGSFARSIRDPQQEIGLVTSRNPNDVIASKLNRTLSITDDGDKIILSASNLAQTEGLRDLVARRDSGMQLHLVPVVRPDSGTFEDVLEDPSEGNARIRYYNHVTLLAFQLTARPPKGTQIQEEIRRWAGSILLPV